MATERRLPPIITTKVYSWTGNHQAMRRKKRQRYTLVPTPEQLVIRFLGEAIAAAVGVGPNMFSVAELGTLAADKRYGDLHDALFAYFDSLEPYRKWGDFQMLATLPRPRPLQLLIEPSILYGHFRAWLRKQGINPDTVPPPAHHE
jgi:hypothetical protein